MPKTPAKITKRHLEEQAEIADATQASAHENPIDNANDVSPLTAADSDDVNAMPLRGSLSPKVSITLAEQLLEIPDDSLAPHSTMEVPPTDLHLSIDASTSMSSQGEMSGLMLSKKKTQKSWALVNKHGELEESSDGTSSSGSDFIYLDEETQRLQDVQRVQDPATANIHGIVSASSISLTAWDSGWFWDEEMTAQGRSSPQEVVDQPPIHDDGEVENIGASIPTNLHDVDIPASVAAWRLSQSISSFSDSDNSDFVQLDPLASNGPDVSPISRLLSALAAAKTSADDEQMAQRVSQHAHAENDVDSLPELVDDRCESDISDSEDDASQAGDIANIPLTDGSRAYRHLPNTHINTVLSMLAFAALCLATGIGIGHFHGSVQEAALRQDQNIKIKSLQDDYLMCLREREHSPRSADKVSAVVAAWKKKYSELLVEKVDLDMRYESVTISQFKQRREWLKNMTSLQQDKHRLTQVTRHLKLVTRTLRARYVQLRIAAEQVEASTEGTTKVDDALVDAATAIETDPVKTDPVEDKPVVDPCGKVTKPEQAQKMAETTIMGGCGRQKTVKEEATATPRNETVSMLRAMVERTRRQLRRHIASWRPIHVGCMMCKKQLAAGCNGTACNASTVVVTKKQQRLQMYVNRTRDAIAHLAHTISSALPSGKRKSQLEQSIDSAFTKTPPPQDMRPSRLSRAIAVAWKKASYLSHRLLITDGLEGARKVGESFNAKIATLTATLFTQVDKGANKQRDDGGDKIKEVEKPEEDKKKLEKEKWKKWKAERKAEMKEQKYHHEVDVLEQNDPAGDGPREEKKKLEKEKWKKWKEDRKAEMKEQKYHREVDVSEQSDATEDGPREEKKKHEKEKWKKWKAERKAEKKEHKYHHKIHASEQRDATVIGPCDQHTWKKQQKLRKSEKDHDDDDDDVDDDDDDKRRKERKGKRKRKGEQQDFAHVTGTEDSDDKWEDREQRLHQFYCRLHHFNTDAPIDDDDLDDLWAELKDLPSEAEMTDDDSRKPHQLSVWLSCQRRWWQARQRRYLHDAKLDDFCLAQLLPWQLMMMQNETSAAAEQDHEAGWVFERAEHRDGERQPGGDWYFGRGKDRHDERWVGSYDDDDESAWQSKRADSRQMRRLSAMHNRQMRELHARYRHTLSALKAAEEKMLGPN